MTQPTTTERLRQRSRHETSFNTTKNAHPTGRGSQPSNTTPNHDPHDAGSHKNLVVQLRTIDPNNLMVLLDFRRKLVAGENGQVCTAPNVAYPSGAQGPDGLVVDADEPKPSRRPDVLPQRNRRQRGHLTASDTSVGERPNDESDAPDTASRSPRTVGRIKQTKCRPLTPEQRQQVVDLYRTGVPVKEIVRQTGVNRSTVYRLRGQAGLERNHRFTDEDRAQAIRLRQQGLTIAEIAKRLSFSHMTIWRYLAAAREERRQQRWW